MAAFFPGKAQLLFAVLLLVFGLSGCALLPGQNASTPPPATTAPTNFLQPQTVSTANLSAVAGTALGFKVAGWT